LRVWTAPAWQGDEEASDDDEGSTAHLYTASVILGSRARMAKPHEAPQPMGGLGGHDRNQVPYEWLQPVAHSCDLVAQSSGRRSDQLAPRYVLPSPPASRRSAGPASGPGDTARARSTSPDGRRSGSSESAHIATARSRRDAPVSHHFCTGKELAL